MDLRGRVACYCRVSKAEKKGQESGSIRHQKALLRQYMSYLGLDPDAALWFVDDGYSGMTEDRPGYETLLAEIMKGAVHTVLVKDFSRLTREHLVLGRLRELFFPSYGVRLLSVGDVYDSMQDLDGGLQAEVRGLFYEFYSRDISRKVKMSLQSRKEAGSYAVAKVPYGYRKDGDSWRIEQAEAENIRLLFACAGEGMSCREAGERIGWDAARVWYVLHNPVYAGFHVWHRYENFLGQFTVTGHVPRQHWYMEKQAHPAIVSEELFAQIQGRMMHQEPLKRKKRHIFSGVTKCRHCGHALVAGRRKKEELCCRNCTGKEQRRVEIGALLEAFAAQCVIQFREVHDPGGECGMICEKLKDLVQIYRKNGRDGMNWQEETGLRLCIRQLARCIEVDQEGNLWIWWNFVA